MASTDDCQQAALDLVKRWSIDQVRELYADVTRGGFTARAKGIRVVELARELLAIADEGLRRQAAVDVDGRDERRYLEPVREAVERGRTFADDLLHSWTGRWEQRIEHLVRDCALRA